MKLVEQIPDLGHCWIRFTPRPWPGDDGRLWLDLSTSRLGRSRPAILEGSEQLAAARADDVVYLPPVEPKLEVWREELASSLRRAQTPILVQQVAGSSTRTSGADTVVDVLHAIATGDLDCLSGVPSGVGVVWPLVAGYTDDPLVWKEGLRRLANAGVAYVLGLGAELPPGDRRQIVERVGESGFDRLFHGSEPSLGDFSSMVSRFGLEALPVRPILGLSGRTASNRQLAGQLSLIGELWLRLGRGESEGQGFFRAARLIERENHDFSSLARDGNLGIVTWLDKESRNQVEEMVASGRSGLLDDLRRDYLDGS